MRFNCTGCGDCCTGGAGYVWVNGEDIAEMAAVVEMSVEDFEAEYVRRVGVRKSLIEYDNGDCVFFDNKSRKCTRLRGSAAPVPHLALLGLEHPDARSLGGRPARSALGAARGSSTRSSTSSSRRRSFGFDQCLGGPWR